MEQLTDYEIALNQRLADALDAHGLNLRRPELREEYFRVLIELYKKETEQMPDFINRMPEQQSFRIVRPLLFGKDWQL
jgi:hypothetical protein